MAGTQRRPLNGPKIRLQSTSALLALSTSCPTAGRGPVSQRGWMEPPWARSALAFGRP
jgi:hypothetical protein